jgi:hypothetical protein
MRRQRAGENEPATSNRGSKKHKCNPTSGCAVIGYETRLWLMAYGLRRNVDAAELRGF